MQQIHNTYKVRQMVFLLINTNNLPPNKLHCEIEGANTHTVDHFLPSCTEVSARRGNFQS